MDEKKQIEEMAKVILHANDNYDTCNKDDCEVIASLVYNAGYRKQSEPFSCNHENGGEWISVDERLPGDIGEYIVMIQGAVIPTTLWYDPWEGVWHEYNRNLEYYVSHWMPLPEAPKMKGGGE